MLKTSFERFNNYSNASSRVEGLSPPIRTHLLRNEGPVKAKPLSA
jgi:hypothetical protein